MLREYTVPIICILVPILTYVLDVYDQALTGGILKGDVYEGGYQFGSELLIVNGLLTYLALYAISKKNEKTVLSS
jgi:hypothetical protein